jgi:ABC-type sugar transport system permease subunit
MSLCKYKDIFGKVNEGLHSYRIFNIAVVDLGLTILIALIIAYFLQNKFLKIPLYKLFGIIFIILMVLSLLLHKLFCVETTLTKIVFGS